MSSLMTPLKSAGGLGVASDTLLSWAKVSASWPDAAHQPSRAPTASTASNRTFTLRYMEVSPVIGARSSGSTYARHHPLSNAPDYEAGLVLRDEAPRALVQAGRRREVIAR